MAHNADIQAVETNTISIDFALISTFPYIERLRILYNHHAADAKATLYGLLATKDGVPIKYLHIVGNAHPALKIVCQ